VKGAQDSQGACDKRLTDGPHGTDDRPPLPIIDVTGPIAAGGPNRGDIVLPAAEDGFMERVLPGGETMIEKR